jgi:hypothetical protein
MSVRTELLEQDCQHRAAKIRQLGEDKKERTAEKDSQNSTARTGQPQKQFSQNKTSRTGQAGRTGLPAQH